MLDVVEALRTFVFDSLLSISAIVSQLDFDCSYVWQFK